MQGRGMSLRKIGADCCGAPFCNCVPGERLRGEKATARPADRSHCAHGSDRFASAGNDGSGREGHQQTRYGGDCLPYAAGDRGSGTDHVPPAAAAPDSSTLARLAAFIENPSEGHPGAPQLAQSLQMAAVFGELERAMLRRRVSARLTRAKAQGKRLGRPAVAAQTGEGLGVWGFRLCSVSSERSQRHHEAAYRRSSDRARHPFVGRSGGGRRCGKE
jgi:hypothetical protein